MEDSVVRQFSCNYKQIIIDEIALEGLEGITLDLLWRRVGKRLSAGITEKLKEKYWRFIVNSNLSFYEVPEPIPHVEIIDRFTMIDEATGHLDEPEDYLDGPYEYNPIDHEYGSCKYYNTRKRLTNLNNLSYEKAMFNYGETLVVVASVEDRWHALASHLPITYFYQMLAPNFCLLELIGKSRENGQMTVGKTNLHKIIKDSKTLFYNRKSLQDLGLVQVQNITQLIKGKAFKCLLIRLKRFHKPALLSMPKAGLVNNVIQYLLSSPDYCERTDVLVKKGVFTQKQNRRFQKTINVFRFEDREIPVPTSNTKYKKRKVNQKRRYIYLSPKSDDSGASDEESNEPDLKCQYNIGISLMRQAYERFLEAGLQGLTQMQLSHLLGVEFYTSRAICRIFRIRNIVREYMEDKGKQRTARFVAVVATNKMDSTYEEQRKLFLKNLEQCKNEEPQEAENNLPSDNDEDIPLKIIKLEKDASTSTPEDVIPNNDITEIKVLDGFENSKSLVSFQKNPTLRQLKFANGLLKVLKEKLCVSGYITLSNLASKAVNEPPMDTKGLKSFIQKLIADGHIKMYKIKWPGINRYSMLICAHHITITHPIIRAKYKEICVRAVISKQENTKKELVETKEPMKIRYSYPRYMKIQKLHEYIMNIAYFDYAQPLSHTLPRGFVSVIDLYPEATVEFLINNLTTTAASPMYQLIDDCHLPSKLKDTPQLVYTTLIKSKHIQNSLRANLKVLAMLGLIQLVSYQTAVTNEPGLSANSTFLFYVNRYAKILDTSGTWPRSTMNANELSFSFETADDVAQYWHNVYNISIATEIIYPERGRKHLRSPLRKADEVKMYDTGERFGDGYGPCGFDSCFFMELPRLWHNLSTRVKKRLLHVKPKKTQETRIKKTRAKSKKPCKPKKPVIERPPIPSFPVKRRRPDTTIKFSKREDLLLTVCKAAITIMSPNSQPGSLIVRNTVAKDLLSVDDPRKTKGICHSRAVTIDSNISLLHEKQCIINEMRRRRELVQKYEGLLKKLRLKYSTNMTKFINKARLPMLELIWIILQVMKTDSYTQRLPCVAVNLEDFHNHFTVTTSTANKLCNMYKLSENSPLKEAIVMTVMQTIDNDIDAETAQKIFEAFKAYPESALRIAVDQLRKCSAIAAKEKMLNNQMRKLDIEDISQSSYKISVFYKRRWICRLNTSEFVDRLAEILSSVRSEMEIKGSAEINCAICEMGAAGIMEIASTSVPVITDEKGVPISGDVTAVTIDAKYHLTTGTMRWKKKGNIRVSKIYVKTDLSKSLGYFSSANRLKADEIETQSSQNLKDDVVSYLEQKAEKGATLIELQNVFRNETNTSLSKKLLDLESRGVIKKVGFYENVVIMTKYFGSWSTRFGNEYIISAPWLDVNSGVKIDVLAQWMGVTMNAIFEKPGSSIAHIADKLEFITCRAVQDICTFLEEHKCVTFKAVKMPAADLFSDDDVEPEFYEYSPFCAPEDILIFPTKNCLTQYAHLRKMIIEQFTDSSYDM